MSFGRGATILSTDTSFPAAELLAAGDLITSIDGQVITSSERALVALAGRQAGEVVEVTVARAGEEVTQDVPLGAAADNPTVGRLGVALGTSIESFELGAFPDQAPERALVVGLEGTLYFMDPTGPAWASLDVPATSGNVVLLDSDLHVFQLSASGLINLNTGETVALPVGDKGLIQVLGALGESLIVSIGNFRDAQIVNAEIASIDLAASSINWRIPMPDLGSDPVIPLRGYAAGDGSSIAITSSVSGRQQVHTLISADGQILAGYGVANTPFIRSDAILGGWLDGDRLTYVYADQERGLTIAIRDASSEEDDVTIPLSGITAVTQMWTIPRSDRAVLATPMGTLLVNVTNGSTVYQLTSGCTATVLTSTAG